MSLIWSKISKAKWIKSTLTSSKMKTRIRSKKKGTRSSVTLTTNSTSRCGKAMKRSPKREKRRRKKREENKRNFNSIKKSSQRMKFLVLVNKKNLKTNKEI